VKLWFCGSGSIILPIESVIETDQNKMVNNLFEPLVSLVLFLLFLMMLVDLILNGTWNKTYFTTGVVVFTRKIQVDKRHGNIPSLSRFNSQFQSWWTNPIVFREIEPYTYGFRETLLTYRLFRYAPQMRGVMFFDFGNNQVVVKGFLNWWGVCELLIGIGVGFLFLDLTFTSIILFILIFVFGISFCIQYYRYSNVATFAAKAWTREYKNEILAGLAATNK